MVSVGDVDGDGAADFAVGATQMFFSPDATGYVQLISHRRTDRVNKKIN
jgi:FG-GAP repeat protein